MEVPRVRTDLALMNGRQCVILRLDLLRQQILDRVLNGHNMQPALARRLHHHRDGTRRFPGPCRTRENDQPLAVLFKPPDGLLRQPQFRRRRDVLLQQPKTCRELATLAVQVYPVPAPRHRDGEILV